MFNITKAPDFIKDAFPGCTVVSFNCEEHANNTQLLNISGSVLESHARPTFSLYISMASEFHKIASCWEHILRRKSYKSINNQESYEFIGNGTLIKFIEENINLIRDEMWKPIFDEQIDKVLSES